ncbi:DUF6191 domain-containing protein [Nocardia jiangxiensis]|uniref:DUF6191 domain-containing protein n=1 Tax=Nocardia jiangxiensis TaxID=282685 RepID=A0ABW6S555_9NOCA|nr:DUF6191 domain-containing protein [Nocardia jiangxiensis]
MLFAMTIPGLVVLITVVACGDVLYRRLTGRTALPWMRGSGGPGAAAIGLEELDAVFGAAKRIEFQQRQVVLMHRENPGDGAPGGLGVDLGTGRVTFRRPG